MTKDQEVKNKIVCENLSRTAASKELTLQNCTDETKSFSTQECVSREKLGYFGTVDVQKLSLAYYKKEE